MRKKLVVVAFLALFVIGITGTLQALPQGGTGRDITFYSDDTFSEAVGGWYMECESRPSRWGIRTVYVEAFEWDCQDYATILPCNFWVCDFPTDNPNSYTGCHCV
jgi:hypothetical protein